MKKNLIFCKIKNKKITISYRRKKKLLQVVSIYFLIFILCITIIIIIITIIIIIIIIIIKSLLCLTRDREAAGSSLTGVTALRSLSKTHLS